MAAAAERSLRDYAAGLAKAHREAADKAAEFQSHAAAREFLSVATKAAREAAFDKGPYTQAVDDRLKPAENKYDAGTFADVERAAADGFERVAK